MIGGCGRIEIGQVAVDALIADPFKGQEGLRPVAIVAIGQEVTASEWKAVLEVQLGNIVDQPILDGMAAGTVGPDRLPMHVGMARNAVGSHLGEHEAGMARPAIDGGMASFEWKLGIEVVERQGILAHDPAGCGGPPRFGDLFEMPGIGRDLPTVRRMAGGTIHFQLIAMRRLGGHGKSQAE